MASTASGELVREDSIIVAAYMELMDSILIQPTMVDPMPNGCFWPLAAAHLELYSAAGNDPLRTLAKLNEPIHGN